MGAVELYTIGFCWKFQANADFEVKSTVATYFCNVFADCLGIFVSMFCFLAACGDKIDMAT